MKKKINIPNPNILKKKNGEKNSFTDCQIDPASEDLHNKDHKKNNIDQKDISKKEEAIERDKIGASS